MPNLTQMGYQIFLRLVLNCSDQQIFTEDAYALLPQFWRRWCTISVHQYNIAASIVLLPCVTHITSSLLVSKYLKYPWLTIVRVLLMAGLFLVCSRHARMLWTSNVSPPVFWCATKTDSLLVLAAACFQSDQLVTNRHAQAVIPLHQPTQSNSRVELVYTDYALVRPFLVC